MSRRGLAFAPTYTMVDDSPMPEWILKLLSPLSRLKDEMASSGMGNINITFSGELIVKDVTLSMYYANRILRLRFWPGNNNTIHITSIHHNRDIYI